jgi:branched-chain amino acid transport system permease protein
MQQREISYLRRFARQHLAGESDARSDVLVNSQIKIVALFAVAAFIVDIVGAFTTGPFTHSVLTRAFLFAVPALTVDVLWGYTGILSFGQGAFFGIGAYAAALSFTYLGYTPTSAILALFVAVAVVMLFAAVIGWLAFWHGATSFYIAVVTLVFPIALVQSIFAGGSFTGASTGLVGFQVPSLSLSVWFFIAGAFLIIVSGLTWVFVHSDYGRLLDAIRDNEQRCRYLGVNTSRVKIYLMMVMAAVAAVAGYIYANATTAVAPQNAGFVFGTELVVYVALGGRRTILGPVIGTIGLVWISAYLSGSLPFVWKLFIGIAFLLVIVLLPQGLLPPIWQYLIKLFHKITPFLGNANREAATIHQQEGYSTTLTGGTLKDNSVALRLENVTKNYGSLSVLSGIDLTVTNGELVGFVGPNGAGKTTLLRCISDGLERSSGSIRVNGTEIGRRSPTGIVHIGLGRSFQHTSVMESLTVTECLRLARYLHWRPSKIYEARDIRLPFASLQVLEYTDLIRSLDRKVYHLSHGMKRALELAMVLALEPSVLLLDEPTAGLTKVDRDMVGKILVKLKEDLGLAIILIEHDFEFVKEVCTRLVVLHQGRLVLDGSVTGVVNSSIVQEIYAGGSRAQ